MADVFTKEQRRIAALRDVEAALDNLIEVVDMADEMPVSDSRASGAIAVASYAAQSARAVTRDEIDRREHQLVLVEFPSIEGRAA